MSAGVPTGPHGDRSPPADSLLAFVTRTHLLHRGRLCALVLCCFAAGLLAAAPALGAPEEVVVDYGDNGRLDQHHSVSDLRGALALFVDNPQYGSFADLVSAALDRELLGLQRPDQSDEPAAAPDADEEAAPAPAAPRTPPPAAPAPGEQRVNEVLSAPRAQAPAVAPPDPVPAVASVVPDALPEPPLADPDSDLPLPFIILTSLAAVLLLSGIGAAVHRRLSG